MGHSTRYRSARVLLAAAVLALCLPLTAQALDRFTLGMPDAEDDSFFSPDNLSIECKGKNISPALYWTFVPKGTHSYALVLHDPDGQKGLGVDHWLRYGLPADLDQVATGVGGESKLEGVGGKNSHGTEDYVGPCPPIGDTAHHYVIQLYALDLAPDALEPGLTRSELLDKIKGHILGVSSLVRRYQR
ncbi:MAG: family phospholipid-binding protein [Pseudomonas sp.]|nr:family phospholipid-binding protein [Pseudomonas sp.]